MISKILKLIGVMLICSNVSVFADKWQKVELLNSTAKAVDVACGGGKLFVNAWVGSLERHTVMEKTGWGWEWQRYYYDRCPAYPHGGLGVDSNGVPWAILKSDKFSNIGVAAEWRPNEHRWVIHGSINGMLLVGRDIGAGGVNPNTWVQLVDWYDFHEYGSFLFFYWPRNTKSPWKHNQNILANRTDVDERGLGWVVDLKGYVLRQFSNEFDNNGYVHVAAPPASDIAAKDGNSVWIVGREGDGEGYAHYFNGTNWQVKSDFMISRVAVDDKGNAYAVTKSGELFKYCKQEVWVADFRVDTDWGNGFTGTISIKNNGTEDIKNWVLEFDWDREIKTIWNAEIVSHTGNHYVIRCASWNSVIEPGGSVNFGFTGVPGNVDDEPLDYKLTLQ